MSAAAAPVARLSFDLENVATGRVYRKIDRNFMHESRIGHFMKIDPGFSRGKLYPGVVMFFGLEFCFVVSSIQAHPGEQSYSVKHLRDCSYISTPKGLFIFVLRKQKGR